MANRKNTSTTREPNSATQAESFIQAANPLSNQSVVVTVQAVNAVLSLLQNYALCEAEQTSHVYSSDGMYFVLECCKSALNAHAAQEGVAA